VDPKTRDARAALRPNRHTFAALLVDEDFVLMTATNITPGTR
jgi:hypothetical protein